MLDSLLRPQTPPEGLADGAPPVPPPPPGFGTTAKEESAVLAALSQLGPSLTTLHLQSLGTPAHLHPDVLSLCPRLAQLSTHVGDVSPLFSSPSTHASLRTLLLGHIPRPFKPTGRTLGANAATLAKAVEQLVPVYDGGRFPALRFVGSGGLDFGRLLPGAGAGEKEDEEESEMRAVWDELGRTADRLREVGLGVMDRYGEVLEER